MERQATRVAAAVARSETRDMHAEGLDGLHELVREAARPYWIRGDLAEALDVAWVALTQACPKGDVWFVDPGAAQGALVQTGVEALLGSLATFVSAAGAVADTPQAAYEVLCGMSLCARYVDQAVSAEQVDRVVRASAALGADPRPAAIDRVQAEAPRAAWPMVTAHLLEALVQPAVTSAAAGTRALYLRIVEDDDASARAAALRCGELLRAPATRRRAIAALSPNVIDRLGAADRVVIPSVLALELQDGWLEGERVVRGWGAIDAAQLLWDDFLPAARAQVVEAIGFGLQNGEPELQAYLARVVCGLAPLLVGREAADLARGLARALVRRNAVDAADEVLAVADRLPATFCAALLDAIAVQQPNGPQDAAAAVRAALGDAHSEARAS
jgi:hypothetical protein